jgi:two-component system, sensor histidine kinase YesM
MAMPVWKRIKDFYLNLSIGKKLLLVNLVVFIVPFVFLVVYGYDMVQGLLLDRIKNEMENDISIAGQSIGSTVDSCVTAAYTIVFDKEIQYALQEDYMGDEYIQAYNYIGPRVDSMLTLNPDIVSFSIYTNNDTLHGDDVTIKNIDDKVRSEEWYKQMKSDVERRFVYVPQLKRKTNSSGLVTVDKYVITAYMRLPYYVGSYNDIFYCMDINEKSISTYLYQNVTGEEMLLLDENGRIIASENSELLGKPSNSVLNMAPGIESGDGWFDSNITGKSNEKLLVRYTTLKNNWKIVSFVSYGYFLSEAKQSSLQFIAVYIGMLPLLVMVLYLTSRIWTRRIRTIIRMMKQLEQGNFLIQGSYENGDEFNEMLRSFVKMSNKIDKLIKEVYVKEVSKKEAELNNLQFLINPHFLYNTLSSIRAMANKSGDSKTSYMINRLARFYRIALSKGSSLITIKDEIDLLKCYLDIQNERFVDQISIHYDLDESLSGYKTLKLILQPFVENSINHGIWDQNSCINIVIRLYAENDSIIFNVIDDGIGFDIRKKMNETSVESLSGGFGIENVNNRIKMSFGTDYGVSIHSLYGFGTSVEIRIPRVI